MKTSILYKKTEKSPILEFSSLESFESMTGINLSKDWQVSRSPDFKTKKRITTLVGAGWWPKQKEW